MKIRKIARIIYLSVTDAAWRYRYLNKVGIYRILKDRTFLEKTFPLVPGGKLDLQNPMTFNQKTQWLKLFDRRPEYTRMVDKYAVRDFIAKTIGEEHLIPLVGVWNDPYDINFDSLPNQFVLKCNHNSGEGMYFCRDKSKIGKKEIRRIKRDLKKALKINYYYYDREWVYKNVPPKVICEQYMVDESGYELKDYKVFTFGGRAKYIQVDYDRFTDHHRNFYSREWEYVPFTTLYPTNPDHEIKKPECLNELLKLSEKLADAAGKPAFLRVDMYIINNKIYFGELTFYHGGGRENFMPEEYDRKLGDLILLK